MYSTAHLDCVYSIQSYWVILACHPPPSSNLLHGLKLYNVWHKMLEGEIFGFTSKIGRWYQLVNTQNCQSTYKNNYASRTPSLGILATHISILHEIIEYKESLGWNTAILILAVSM